MKIKYIISLIFLTLFLVGCDNSNDPAPPPPTPEIESLDVTPKAETLDVGTTQKYTATAKYSDNSFEDVSDQVTWSLTNNNGSIVFDQADPSMARAAAAGTDFIVATLGTLTTPDSKRAAVTVVDSSLVSLVVEPADSDLIVGVDRQFSATGTYADGHTQDLTEESDWTSGDTDLVTISEVGLASPLDKGNTTITASYDGQTDTATVSINYTDEIEGIVITPEGYDFLTGELKQFSAYAYFADPDKDFEAVTQKCSWESSNTSVVATVVGVNARPGYFEAKDITGDATITAYFDIRNQATINVSVEKPSVTRIQISPTEVTLSVGDSMKFFTDAVDQDGMLHSINTNPDQEYTVLDPSIVSIANDPDNAGAATALSVGQTTVTSTFVYEGQIFTTQALVTVTP
jgi:trimeric autotransporter adhesin